MDCVHPLLNHPRTGRIQQHTEFPKTNLKVIKPREIKQERVTFVQRGYGPAEVSDGSRLSKATRSVVWVLPCTRQARFIIMKRWANLGRRVCWRY